MALDLLFLALSRRRVVPLYTRVDALRLTESRPTHTNVSGSVTYLTCRTLQVYAYMGVYTYGPQAAFRFGLLTRLRTNRHL